MDTSVEQGTLPANHDQAPKEIAETAAAEFLRLLRHLWLDPLHWEANQAVQRTVASRRAEWRCGRARRLAPVADLGVGPTKPCCNSGQSLRMSQTSWFGSGYLLTCFIGVPRREPGT